MSIKIGDVVYEVDIGEKPTWTVVTILEDIKTLKKVAIVNRFELDLNTNEYKSIIVKKMPLSDLRKVK